MSTATLGGKYSSFLAEFWRWKRKIRAFWLRPIWRFGFRRGFVIEATTASPSNTVH
ncbi:Uncharacterised protein [Vibrio cholerae]|nr:Uncharacterised protein [Vibrio cholerae]